MDNEEVYYCLVVDQIPTRTSFEQILAAVAPYSRHIIGIAREADYTNKRLKDTIYLYCTRKEDADHLERSSIDFRLDGRPSQMLTFIDLRIGRAHLCEDNHMHKYDGIPVTLRLHGLRQCRVSSEGFTYYLKEIVSNFERQGRVTSIRLGYDERKKLSRKDAFVTFLCQQDANEILKERIKGKILINNRLVGAQMSHNIPMLVRAENANLMPYGLIQWSKEIEWLNVLMYRETHPFIFARNEDFDYHLLRPANTNQPPFFVQNPCELPAHPTQSSPAVVAASTVTNITSTSNDGGQLQSTKPCEPQSSEKSLEDLANRLTFGSPPIKPKRKTTICSRAPSKSVGGLASRPTNKSIKHNDSSKTFHRSSSFKSQNKTWTREIDAREILTSKSSSAASKFKPAGHVASNNGSKAKSVSSHTKSIPMSTITSEPKVKSLIVKVPPKRKMDRKSNDKAEEPKAKRFKPTPKEVTESDEDRLIIDEEVHFE